jgi:hypothetical protein
MFRSGRLARDVIRSCQSVLTSVHRCSVLLPIMRLWQDSDGIACYSVPISFDPDTVFDKAVDSSMLVLWVVTSCGLVDSNVSEEHTASIFRTEDT